jgi:hypothetical protein
MKLILAVLSMFCVTVSVAQYTDTITLKLENSVMRSHTDFVSTIDMRRKDGGSFLIPRNYTIGNETDLPVDLVYIVEKLNDKNVYRNYLCKYINIPTYAVNVPKHKFYTLKGITIVDSLSSLECIDSGSYRVKVMYNEKLNDGVLNPHNLIVGSDWVYFRVAVKEITLSSYRRERIKELEQKKQ